MLSERGIVVSYETIRRWGLKSARTMPAGSEGSVQAPNDIRHLAGIGFGRAVDQDGYVLDEILQNRRNTKAAKRFLMRLLKKQAVAPKRMVTDKLGSYGSARRQVMPNVEHRSHKGPNNQAENSHLPLRKRERTTQDFRSPGSLQRFISIFSALRNLFVPPRSKRSAPATTITACKPWRNGKPRLGGSRELRNHRDRRNHFQTT